MVLTWYGQACFKLQSGETVLAFDPFAKEIGLTPPRFRADVLLVSHRHYDHANADAIGGEPFRIEGPGEYEVKGVYIQGIETFHDPNQGRERGLNTMYRADIEGIRVLHMGDFGEEKLRDETLSAVGDVDVLLIPVGGSYTIDAEQAARVVRAIEPRFVVPMHYRIPGLTIGLDPVVKFLKEMGIKEERAEEKLTLRKRDVAEGGEKTEVRVLKPA